MSQHHLIIGGAGAVGVTFAHSLYKAHEKVSIFVRETHRNKFYKDNQGSPIHNFFRILIPKASPVHIPLEQIIYSIEDISTINSQLPFNFIWLTIPTAELKKVNLEDIALAAPDSLIINLSAGVLDYRYLLEKYPKLRHRICQSAIWIIAYQTPIKGSRVNNCCKESSSDAITVEQKGIAAFSFPGGVTKLGGPIEKHPILQNVAKLLSDGGIETVLYSNSPNPMDELGSMSAVGVPFVLCLETMNWSFGELISKEPSSLFAHAAIESMQAYKAKWNDNSPPRYRVQSIQWFSQVFSYFISTYGNQILPIDLEAFLKTKVGGEMLEQLDEYIKMARECNTECIAMEELREMVLTCRE